MTTSTDNQPDSAKVLDWVERFALRLSEVGSLPLIAGRILGWLMVCEPAEQTADEIADAIGASRASLSTNLRLLTSVRMVGMTSRPGKRQRYYRIEPDAWEAVIRIKIASLASFRHMAEDGIALIGPGSDRAERLTVTRNAFSWLHDVFASAPPPPDSNKET